MGSFTNIAASVSTTAGTADYVTGVATFNTISLATALTDGTIYGYRAYYSDGTTAGVEVGRGVWTSATSTLARTTIETSSNANAKVSWSGAELIIEVVLTAAQLDTLSNTLNIDGGDANDITNTNIEGGNAISVYGGVDMSPLSGGGA